MTEQERKEISKTLSEFTACIIANYELCPLVVQHLEKLDDVIIFLNRGDRG